MLSSQIILFISSKQAKFFLVVYYLIFQNNAKIYVGISPRFVIELFSYKFLSY